MAEFQEVMRQWARMCGAHNNCSACRMQKENLPYTLCSEGGIRSVENIADVELAIMAWAAEHPEPEYPSWIDFLSTVGLIIQTNDCTTCAFDFTKAYTQIPADIAEKLGIKPKGEC